jgi:putative Ca2+/H+ antiporter (TMEM165/GDT1 family)
MDFAGFPSLAGLDRAIAVIVVSEIGDKTFLMYALFSRHLLLS